MISNFVLFLFFVLFPKFLVYFFNILKSGKKYIFSPYWKIFLRGKMKREEEERKRKKDVICSYSSILCTMVLSCFIILTKEEEEKLTCPRSTSRDNRHLLGSEPRWRNLHPTSSIIIPRTRKKSFDES